MVVLSYHLLNSLYSICNTFYSPLTTKILDSKFHMVANVVMKKNKKFTF